jgi:hypothetical protein
VSEDGADLVQRLTPEGLEGSDAEIMFFGSTPREALAHYRILFPELISYRGGLFVQSQFDQALVDDMFDQAGFDGGLADMAAAEEALNSVGLLFEGLFEGQVEFDPVLARANAAAIGWVWKRWIRESYGREIEVVTCIEGEDACYVTFRSLAPDAA